MKASSRRPLAVIACRWRDKLAILLWRLPKTAVDRD